MPNDAAPYAAAARSTRYNARQRLSAARDPGEDRHRRAVPRRRRRHHDGSEMPRHTSPPIASAAATRLSERVIRRPCGIRAEATASRPMPPAPTLCTSASGASASAAT